MSIDTFFNPKSVAIIGASGIQGKVGHTLFKKLKEFKGKLYLVNKQGYLIDGSKTYARLLEIRERIDLVVIAVPAKYVVQVLKDCISRKVHNVIIISAGLDYKIKDDVLRVCKKGKINFIGPNCFGVVNSSNFLDTTFSSTEVGKGQVGFISQSGAIWSGIVELGLKYNLGFSKFVSLGDMWDVSFDDFLGYFNSDRSVKVILLYIEGLKDGLRFLEVVKRCRKPVVVVKGGRFSSEAVVSHTGSLAGDYNVYKSLIKGSGGYFVDSLVEGFNLCRFFVNDSFKGSDVVVVSNAGGPEVLLSDYLISGGLELSDVSNFKFKFSWSERNPIDLLGDAKADKFETVFSRLVKFKTSIVVLVLTPQDMTEVGVICERFVEFKRKSKKVCVACLLGAYSVEAGRLMLERNGILCFDRLEDVASLLKFSRR